MPFSMIDSRTAQVLSMYAGRPCSPRTSSLEVSLGRTVAVVVRMSVPHLLERLLALGQLLLHLHRAAAAGRGRPGHLPEQALGRLLPGDHRVGHGVGVLLIGIADGPTPPEVHPGALLDDVGGLVGGGVQVGRAAKATWSPVA
jgi:hypothetical protein